MTSALDYGRKPPEKAPRQRAPREVLTEPRSLRLTPELLTVVQLIATSGGMPLGATMRHLILRGAQQWTAERRA